jgi:outer membrane receptor protein involved in Fe transport
MKNSNDNISAVNPYMAKDIKVLKGGYGAEYGEKVGGIVDISGMDGNRLSPSAQLCVNNMTLNGLASVPYRKKSALVLAYRQTYYDLYNPVEFTSSASVSGSGFDRGWRSGGGTGAQADYYLIPAYIFRDINLKFSGNSRKTNYFISLYGGMDKFSYSFDQDNNHRRNGLMKLITPSFIADWMPAYLS